MGSETTAGIIVRKWESANFRMTQKGPVMSTSLGEGWQGPETGQSAVTPVKSRPLRQHRSSFPLGGSGAGQLSHLGGTRSERAILLEAGE